MTLTSALKEKENSPVEEIVSLPVSIPVTRDKAG